MFFKEPKMLLLAPILIYSGFSQSFFSARMPQAMGEKLIGWVMATFGACDMTGSVIFGRLGDKVGRRTVLIGATVLAAIGYTLSWWVSRERPWLFFVVLGILGFADAGYNTQLQAVFADYQPNKLEAAYAYFKLIQATSSGIAFFYSLFLELHGTAIVVGVSLLVGISSFLFNDIRLQRSQQQL
jgi:MFS family permease